MACKVSEMASTLLSWNPASVTLEEGTGRVPIIFKGLTARCYFWHLSALLIKTLCGKPEQQPYKCTGRDHLERAAMALLRLPPH